MKPHITVITIGVNDLEAALRFYREGLGFPTDGIIGKEFEHGAVVFIQLQPGLRLALWPRKSIGHDTGLVVSSTSPTEMTLGHNVTSKAEVDAVMEKARAAGAVIVKAAHETSGAATRVTSKTQMVISGRLSGIRNGQSELCPTRRSSRRATRYARSTRLSFGGQNKTI